MTDKGETNDYDCWLEMKKTKIKKFWLQTGYHSDLVFYLLSLLKFSLISELSVQTFGFFLSWW